MKITRAVLIRCIQHPNGEVSVRADRDIPDHFKVLASKRVVVEFDVEPHESPLIPSSPPQP